MPDYVHRYLPQQGLPPYSYVPGLFPHPKSHPDGHGCPGPPLTKACASLPDDWPRCSMYLWGFDLFNCGYYWEAHEAWEEVWIVAGRRGELADFVKSLIKLAAAGVKAREGQVSGVRRHAERSLKLLNSVIELTSGDRYCGCRLDQLWSIASDTSQNAASLIDTSQAKAVRVFAGSLKLELPGE